MRIAIISFNQKWVGGGARLIYDLAHVLTDMGHRATVFVPDTEYESNVYAELQQGVDIRLVKMPSPYNWAPLRANAFRRMWYKFKKELWLIRAARIMAEQFPVGEYDVINLHDQAYKFAYYYRKREPNIRIVWTNNDAPYLYLPHPESVIYDWGSWIYNKLKNYTEARFFRTLDTVQVIEFVNARWTEARGMKANVIRPGVDFEKFYDPVRDVTVRAKQKKVQILGFGNLNPSRRYENIVEAVKILRDRGYDANSKIVCRDLWKNAALREKLLTLTKDWGLNIEFNFNGVSEAEARALRHESDVMVLAIHLPPPRDGFPWQLIGIEGMAAGLPLVLSRKNGLCEVLTDGENALFFEPLHAEQIADRVQFLVDNPEKRNEIAKSGQEFTHEKLQWSHYAEEILRLFEGNPHT